MDEKQQMEFNNAVSAIRDFADVAEKLKANNEAISGELKANIEAVNTRLDQFEEATKARQLEAARAKTTETGEARFKGSLGRFVKEHEAVQALAKDFMRFGHSDRVTMSDTYKEAAAEYARVKAALVGDDVQGGYLAPPEMSAEVIQNLREFSPLRQLLNVQPIGRGSLALPVKNGRATAQWVGEAKPASNTDMGWGLKEIKAHKASSVVAASVEALEDIALPYEAEMNTELTESFGILEANGWLFGDGNEKPFGILTNADILAAPAVTGNATAITGDGVVRAVYGLKSTYAARASILLNRNTLREVRLLKDSNGRYLWDVELGLTGMSAPRILGLPYYEAPEMAAPNDAGAFAANSLAMLVGDFRAGYRAVERMAMSMVRDPNTLAELGLVRFVFMRRIGGEVTRAEAFKVLKTAT